MFLLPFSKISSCTFSILLFEQDGLGIQPLHDVQSGTQVRPLCVEGCCHLWRFLGKDFRPAGLFMGRAHSCGLLGRLGPAPYAWHPGAASPVFHGKGPQETSRFALNCGCWGVWQGVWFSVPAHDPDWSPTRAVLHNPNSLRLHMDSPSWWEAPHPCLPLRELSPGGPRLAWTTGRVITAYRSACSPTHAGGAPGCSQLPARPSPNLQALPGTRQPLLGRAHVKEQNQLDSAR